MTKARLVVVAVATTLSVVLLPVVTGNMSFAAVVNSSQPHAPPPPPRDVRAASGSTHTRTGTLTVTHAAGASNDAITKYNATCRSSNGGATKRGAHNGPTRAPIKVTGVTTRKTYRCLITATNAHGTSTPSARSNAVIVGAPGQPRPPSVARIGAGHLKVSFAKPANNGATITSFKAACRSSNGGVARGRTGTASPLGVLHLTRGKRYTCTVQATNSRGAGPVSAPSRAVTPQVVPRNAQLCSPDGRAPANSSRPACATRVAVLRSGAWLIQNQTTVFLGLPGDTPVLGDYNGDGITDVAVYRPSVGGWYVNGRAPVFFGLPGDIPVPGDYNGDGITDVAVYRPSVGGWYIRNQPTVFYGRSTDIPVPGDYDGDGTTDPAVYRSGAWLLPHQSPVFLGLAGDTPVPGDYNADGTTDAAVFRSSVGGWFINGQSTLFFGLPGDVPVTTRPS